MSNLDTPTRTENSPTYIAYQVREGNQKGHWTRIGAAWAHKDGKGFNISLECLPLDGKISLRVVTDKKE